MIDKKHVFKAGDLLRDVEKSVARLHEYLYRMSHKYKDEWNADEPAGDFTTLSGGGDKPPPKEP